VPNVFAIFHGRREAKKAMNETGQAQA